MRNKSAVATRLRLQPIVSLLLCLCTACATTESEVTSQVVTSAPPSSIRDIYEKTEHLIPMRDGVRLFTAVYSPKKTDESYPILLLRTPYSVRPYGAVNYPEHIGPNALLADDGYIFVYQDVRGCYMSEGVFDNMRPHRAHKAGPADIDESTDTYDTIEWLVTNIPHNNGKVGMWGISYPGFYAAAGMIDAHPALKAVSPQAPIADWFFDDFHHHGAFFLPHAFRFFASFGKSRPQPTTARHKRFNLGTPDGYQFYMDMGALGNANDKYLKNQIVFWNDLTQHPNYDDFWQARNLLPHLSNVAPAVMTVGGWFDAEDLYGALQIYRSVEQHNPQIFNVLVMGPWRHGGWARDDGSRLGDVYFGGKTSYFYRAHIERPFFNHFLKGADELNLPEAFVFETGSNTWRRFHRWPPAVETQALYFGSDGTLSFDQPDGDGFDEFVSDPNKPVPFTQEIATGMTREYMVEDQRFAARRPDVLNYQTGVLEEDLTLAGPITATLWCQTSQSAADWIVKVIDVLPNDASGEDGKNMGNYHMMVRSEVIRGRFRNSYEKPEPFEPYEPTQVTVELQDVLHTFKMGHRVMVQVQSTWFPLVDRNPQKYVPNIFEASDDDFTVATHRVYHSSDQPSKLLVGVLAKE